ncbi:hypothetical protein GA0061098_1016135 [Bradyrhizobium shewense]|uniref:Uncharacterized protein n=1 Tax=Bradyrhizobium shewense TaxID=1761772 RepID=A0A1C3XJ65_9BRAD|nr:hypothetical protein GA0061098_1016135 [Bradyrhizobium shewense]
MPLPLREGCINQAGPFPQSVSCTWGTYEMLNQASVSTLRLAWRGLRLNMIHDSGILNATCGRRLRICNC